MQQSAPPSGLPVCLIALPPALPAPAPDLRAGAIDCFAPQCPLMRPADTPITSG